jgi:hypothetical protein
VAAQVPLGEGAQRVLLAGGLRCPEPAADQDVGRLVLGEVRPAAELPGVGGVREQVRRRLGRRIELHAVVGQPGHELAPGQRSRRDLLERRLRLVEQGVVEPELPAPRRAPLGEVGPEEPVHPPEVLGGEHVQGAAHGPGAHDRPVAAGRVHVGGGEPAGAHADGEPAGPHVLRLQPDDPPHGARDSGGGPGEPLRGRAHLSGPGGGQTLDHDGKGSADP